MTMRDEARGSGARESETTLLNAGRLSVGEQVAEQFARYRAEGADTAGYDECGRPTGGYYDELVDPAGGVRRMWSELSADFVELGRRGIAGYTTNPGPFKRFARPATNFRPEPSTAGPTNRTSPDSSV